ncbi:MAG: universal stress protein [Planctomycetota bacterium]
MIERIVVGIDRGRLADHAVLAALALADAFGAQLDFVHGADHETAGRRLAAAARWKEAAATAIERARAECVERLARLAAHPRLARPSLVDRVFVHPTSPPRALLEHVAASRADLLVLGAHRHRPLLDFGGTGRSILARSTVPVWVQPEAPREIHTILAPIDLSPASELVLDRARSMAQTFGARVLVLSAFRPPLFAYDAEDGGASGPTYVIDDARNEERAELTALLDGFAWGGVPAETILAEGEPWTEILDRQDDCDLVVMGTHGRTGFARAVLGSVAYRVLKGARRPVLVVPLPEHAYGDRRA